MLCRRLILLTHPMIKRLKERYNSTDWWVVFSSFQVGFCLSAVGWRVRLGLTEDVFYPAAIGSISLIILLAGLFGKIK